MTQVEMLEELKTESKGDEDYPYNSMQITSITGKVEKSGEAWTFVARGSGQKYDLAPNDTLKKMVEAGKNLNAPITYVEVPGGSHGGVAEPAFAPMLDFFAKQSRSVAASH